MHGALGRGVWTGGGGRGEGGLSTRKTGRLPQYRSFISRIFLELDFPTFYNISKIFSYYERSPIFFL